MGVTLRARFSVRLRSVRQLAFRSIRILLPVALASCSGGEATAPRLTLVFVDYSDSRSPEALAAASRLVAHTIAKGLGPADHLIVLPLDKKTSTEPQRIVDVDLAYLSFAQRGDGMAHAASRQQARRVVFLDSLAPFIERSVLAFRSSRTQAANETDILSAVEIAGRLMREDAAADSDRSSAPVHWFRRPRRPALVILLSDMLHDTPELVLTPNSAPTEVQTVQILRRKRADGTLPSLDGATVVVSGATAARASTLRAQRSFWLRYFTAAQARVLAYDFDASAAIASALRAPR